MIGESFGKLTNLALDEFCRKEVPLQIGEKSYHVRGLHPGQVDIPDAGTDKPVKAGDEDFYLLYFIDVTEMDKEAALYRKTRPSVMLIGAGQLQRTDAEGKGERKVADFKRCRYPP